MFYHHQWYHSNKYTYVQTLPCKHFLFLNCLEHTFISLISPCPWDQLHHGLIRRRRRHIISSCSLLYTNVFHVAIWREKYFLYTQSTLSFTHNHFFCFCDALIQDQLGFVGSKGALYFFWVVVSYKYKKEEEGRGAGTITAARIGHEYKPHWCRDLHNPTVWHAWTPHWPRQTKVGVGPTGRPC